MAKRKDYAKLAPPLTLDRLKEVLRYDPETGVFIWLDRPTALDAWRSRCAGKVAGAKMTIGYMVLSIDNKKYLMHRLAWFYVYGEWPARQVDHINQDRADNRLQNLRQATNTQNSYNKGMNKNNSTGFKCVRWWQKLGRFSAYIKVDGKQYTIGYFDDPKVASAAYLAEAERVQGAFASI